MSTLLHAKVQIDHYQTKVKPVLQAFLSQIESAASNTAANQQRQQGGHTADYLINNGGASTADKLLRSRIPINGPMQTVPLDEDSSNGLGNVGLLLVQPPMGEMMMMPKRHVRVTIRKLHRPFHEIS
ncbi:hypothetical protein IV203_002413 [Nitzschia inconspicua]|nr:hypothetical protein IV203_002413 [Nitzschia inconspicua]